MDENGWELISSYSRAQALADGVLIAPPQTLCEEAGFIVPVALTQAVWEDCVTWDHTDTERTGVPQDETGRLWDVLHMTTYAIRGMCKDGDRVDVELYRIPRRAATYQAVLIQLVAHIGPGDTPEPVITIMQPHED